MHDCDSNEASNEMSEPVEGGPAAVALPSPAGVAVEKLTVGQRVQVEIHDLAFGGEGVGRVGDFVIFVPFVCPGELVDVKVVEVKRSFARGVVARILRRVPERVEPQCRYFEECGGCQYQHLRYASQLQWKQKQIADLFERIGGFPAAVIHPVIPCPSPYGYRNRILVRSQWNKPAQKLNLGYVRADGGLVCDVESCAIAEPGLNMALTEWRKNPPAKGGMKSVLRIPPEDWDVPEHSFFQNNFFALPFLVESVRKSLLSAGTRHLIDAYCGVGFFSLSLADALESFTGVELDAQAIAAARRNQQRRGYKNGEYIAGDADAWLPRLLRQCDPGVAAVLLDPPRVGCQPSTLRVLRASQPAQILYVSCHPATLARDLKILCEGGLYQLASVQPVDMFPQTQHVECVADLRRTGVSKAV